MDHPIDKTIEVFVRYEGKVSSASDRALLQKQVAALKEIKGSLATYGTMRYKIRSFDKLISDPWMEDQIAFEAVYGAWEEFRDSYESEIGGMTVNERLCHLGLMEDFEKDRHSPAKVRVILSAAFLSQENIEAIIQQKTA